MVISQLVQAILLLPLVSLKLHTNTGGATIIMDGTAAATGITVAGNADKTFKVYAGQTIGTNVKQVFAVSQTQVMFWHY